MGEAMMIEATLKARGIHAIIPGLSSGTTAYYSGFVSQVLVNEDQAEEARAIVVELRSSQPAPNDEEEDEPESDRWRDRVGDLSGRPLFDEPRSTTDVRRWRFVTALVSLMITFGLGHVVNRAWMRGITLAGVEALGFYYLAHGQKSAATFLICSAILYDVVGGFLLAGNGRPTSPKAQLPRATLRK
jgi:Putative prokaryotic signal transducing protein